MRARRWIADLAKLSKTETKSLAIIQKPDWIILQKKRWRFNSRLIIQQLFFPVISQKPLLPCLLPKKKPLDVTEIKT
jgi:hypothetical protein